jgi:molybdenum cofactor biosynthesis protein B
MPHNNKTDRQFIPLNIAVLTVSDSRTEETDTSGDLLIRRLTAAGHHSIYKRIEPDDKFRIRATVSAWIVDPAVEVIITTGGTGVTGRDGTPEAILPLLEKVIDGFGEIFRALSYKDIGGSAMQSRALCGIANGTYVFCLPGSTGACRDGWDKLICAQLDCRTQPCNFAEMLPRLTET